MKVLQLLLPYTHAGLHFGITDDTVANSFLVPQKTDKFVGHEWYMGKKTPALGEWCDEVDTRLLFFCFPR